ncbi:MAG TPA: hypothetical protein VFS39_03770 [Nitrospira sp.]|nr:hypothetical protein [Nitrospira sp.]
MGKRDMTALPLATIFWSLLVVEVVGYGFVMWLAATTGGRTPEGPVGGWVIFIPPVVWALLAWLFYATDSPSKRLAYTVVLALPLIQAVVGPVYDRVRDAWWEHGRSGADYFSGPQLKLANAIYEHDVERVKTLIPEAGDLNTGDRGQMTLFDFAMTNTDDSDASFAIIEALLTAGADPNVPPARPLALALYRSPRFARLLLDAGADPNAPDDAGRPGWWTVLSPSNDADLTKLRLLLDRGADITTRDREGGPVAWAAYHKCWRALWLLIEQGAAWQGEQEFGEPVHRMLRREMDYNREAVPEELRRALAKYEEAAGAPSRAD